MIIILGRLIVFDKLYSVPRYYYTQLTTTRRHNYCIMSDLSGRRVADPAVEYSTKSRAWRGKKCNSRRKTKQRRGNGTTGPFKLERHRVYAAQCSANPWKECRFWEPPPFDRDLLRPFRRNNIQYDLFVPIIYFIYTHISIRDDKAGTSCAHPSLLFFFFFNTPCAPVRHHCALKRLSLGFWPSPNMYARNKRAPRHMTVIVHRRDPVVTVKPLREGSEIGQTHCVHTNHPVGILWIGDEGPSCRVNNIILTFKI